ncbi:hypothetical protein LCGC14_2842820, partial [marine sediment metagenome]
VVTRLGLYGGPRAARSQITSQISPLVLPIRGYTFINKPQSMLVAASVDFTTSATLTGSGKLAAAVSIAFSESATVNRQTPWAISPLILPIRVYPFGEGEKRTALISTASIDFTTSATLTATGGLGGSKIQFSTTLVVIGPMFCGSITGFKVAGVCCYLVNRRASSPERFGCNECDFQYCV